HFYGLFEAEGEGLRGRLRLRAHDAHHLLVDRVRCHLAGELACGRAAHAVGDDEQRAPLADGMGADRGLERRLAPAQVRDEEPILIVVARLPQIGLGEDLDLDRLGSWAAEHHQGEHWVRIREYVESLGRSSVAILTHAHPPGRSRSGGWEEAMPATKAA